MNFFIALLAIALMFQFASAKPKPGGDDDDPTGGVGGIEVGSADHGPGGNKEEMYRCAIENSNRVDCLPGTRSRKKCEEKGCCFNKSVRKTVWCFFPDPVTTTTSAPDITAPPEPTTTEPIIPDDTTIIDDPEPTTPPAPVGEINVTYTVHTYTTYTRYGGTNSNCYVTLYGQLGDSGKLALVGSENPDPLEIGLHDQYTFTFQNIGLIQSLKIEHDNTNIHPEWHVTKIVLDDHQLEQSCTMDCNCWMNKNKGDLFKVLQADTCPWNAEN